MPSTVIICLPATAIVLALRMDELRGNDLTSNQREQARIHRQMLHSPPLFNTVVESLYYNCASATASLPAAQLRSLETMLRSDEVEEGPLWIGFNELYPRAIEVEFKMCLLEQSPDRWFQLHGVVLTD